MSTTKNDLIREYRNKSDTLTHRQKAELEESIWERTPAIERAKARMGSRHCRSYYLAEIAGETSSVIAKRCILHNAGVAAIVLWDLVDGDPPLALGAAVELYKRAKSTRKDDESMPMAVNRVVRAYQKGSQAFAPNGTYTHRKKTSQSARPLRGRLAASPTAIKRVVADYAAERTQALPPDRAAQMQKELNRDIEEVIRAFNSRCGRYLKESKNSDDMAKSFTRKNLREAYEILRLTPPKKDTPIDLQAVKKQKRLLVRLYHPDSTGDESMLDIYQSVLEAAELIETVYDQQGGMA